MIEVLYKMEYNRRRSFTLYYEYIQLEFQCRQRRHFILVGYKQTKIAFIKEDLRIVGHHKKFLASFINLYHVGLLCFIIYPIFNSVYLHIYTCLNYTHSNKPEAFLNSSISFIFFSLNFSYSLSSVSGRFIGDLSFSLILALLSL